MFFPLAIMTLSVKMVGDKKNLERARRDYFPVSGGGERRVREKIPAIRFRSSAGRKSRTCPMQRATVMTAK
jgi:hypothetical protein